VVKIQGHFQFRPDWYRSHEVRALVGPYYVVLRSALRSKPKLRSCLRRCVHCGIFFLSHPRNARRRDLRCAFGCQQAHRKQRSTQRSVEYYSSEVGKAKKKMQNGKRRLGDGQPRRVAFERQDQREQEGRPLDACIVRYLAMVTSLIEGRRVMEQEIVEMLARAVRQHSIFRRRRMEYVLNYWKSRARSP